MQLKLVLARSPRVIHHTADGYHQQTRRLQTVQNSIMNVVHSCIYHRQPGRLGLAMLVVIVHVVPKFVNLTSYQSHNYESFDFKFGVKHYAGTTYAGPTKKLKKYVQCVKADKSSWIKGV